MANFPFYYVQRESAMVYIDQLLHWLALNLETECSEY
jgi:hypothetical protein